MIEHTCIPGAVNSQASKGLSINMCWMSETHKGLSLDREIIGSFKIFSSLHNYLILLLSWFFVIFKSLQLLFQILDSIVYLMEDECAISKNSSGSLSGGPGGDSLATCFPFKCTQLPPLSLASDQGRASGRGKFWKVDHWGNNAS